VARKRTAVEVSPTTTTAKIGTPPTIDLMEEPLTPAEVLTRFKIPFKGEKDAARKIYGLTRKRAGRPPLPSHRIGKVLRFYWSEIRRWQQQVQNEKAASK